MTENALTAAVQASVNSVIKGKQDVVEKVLAAILAGGHILMEDIPGVGKTTLAVSLSKALGLEYNRVQFTPDVLPSDITGYSVFDKNTSELRYQKGAVLCNLFIADELNRATSRTQSALLQAMEEGQVTVDNQTYSVPQPFIVIATQNPSGARGTQMLPDSQMDRFMLRLSMGYPAHDDEIEMLRRRQRGVSTAAVHQVMSREELIAIRREAEGVFVKDELLDYIVRLCEATRRDSRITQGASPRASLALTALSKAAAWLQGRDYVLPRDVKFIFSDCIEHRLLWSPDLPDPYSRASALQEIFSGVKAPSIR
jgi:MoxR-like ATPase